MGGLYIYIYVCIYVYIIMLKKRANKFQNPVFLHFMTLFFVKRSQMLEATLKQKLNHPEFQVPKMEVLNLIRLFWGWVFPYINLPYSLYRCLKCLVNISGCQAAKLPNIKVIFNNSCLGFATKARCGWMKIS